MNPLIGGFSIPRGIMVIYIVQNALTNEYMEDWNREKTAHRKTKTQVVHAIMMRRV